MHKPYANIPTEKSIGKQWAQKTAFHKALQRIPDVSDAVFIVWFWGKSKDNNEIPSSIRHLQLANYCKVFNSHFQDCLYLNIVATVELWSKLKISQKNGAIWQEK